jgi:Mg-chelatase subunit ChlD
MTADQERARRWRLVLGQAAEPELEGSRLDAELQAMDRVLEALYDADRKGGLGPSSPSVARWLGDIRTYFPSPVVRVMQADALERLDLRSMLLEPELLAGAEPDIHLVANLLALRKVLPRRTQETARQVVRKLVDDLEKRLREPITRAIRGSLSRAQRTSRPRAGEMDWDRTIRRNLVNYHPGRRTLVAEKVVGYARRRSALRDVILCVDQSGSMASSVVYSSIFGAVMASLRAVSTRFVVFDTAVVDLTEELRDPVELLFGTQLGGGTDINAALAYCQRLVTRPNRTILVLITDLFEGGDADEMRQRAAQLVASGVNVVCLLALDDQGAPAYDHANAAALAALGIPSFACTPDLFPELMAAAIQRADLRLWAARNDLVAAR